MTHHTGNPGGKIVPCFVLALLVLAGCGGTDITDAKPTTGRDPAVAEVPAANETVRGEEDLPVVTLELGEALHERRLSVGGELPGRIIIPTTNLNAVPVTAALQAVLEGTDVSLAWDTGALGDRLVTVMNLSGALPKVVEQICSAAKVFCSYRHGSLELHDKDTFVVSLPPTAKAVGGGGASTAASGGTNSMVDAIGQLIGGSKVQVDEQGGNIIYTTDVEGEERVSRYLSQLRNGRPLVVLQLYIWEVTLDKENGQGINWQSFNLNGIGPGYSKLALDGIGNFSSLAKSSGSMSIGAVTSGRLDTSSLISFLATQGRVQTISNPQITFVSGSGASLKVGGKRRYISQVGTPTSNTSGTSSASTTNTVSTDTIETGLSIDASGVYENGIVFSSLDLKLTGLVSLNETSITGTSGGGVIDLPETTDQKINTVIRVRPGDNLVMAGLVTSNDQNDAENLPFGITTYGKDQVKNHELVVVVKPSVILFSDKAAVAAEKSQEQSQALPTAVMIDKDGAKAIERSAPPPQASPAVPQVSAASVVATPPLAASSPVPAPTVADLPPQPMNLTPSLVRPPVNRSLMQGGLMSAFDDGVDTSNSGVIAGGRAP